VRKILFLDIDGVLNKKDNFNPNRKDSLWPIDSYCAFLAGKIQLDTECEIVLSSSWRWHPDGIKEAKKIVDIIDITPKINASRGEEIGAWLEEHPDVERYAILDDDSDMLLLHIPNFFQTTFETGLTEEIAKAVTKHLNT
jgi:hypothetical protein